MPRWYRFDVTPGAKASIDLTDLPDDFDVAVFRDIGQEFVELNTPEDVDDLHQLSAEFAPSAFSPSALLPVGVQPERLLAVSVLPVGVLPSAFSPSAFSPSAFSPSAFSPSAFSPSAFSPSAFSPSAFSTVGVLPLRLLPVGVLPECLQRRHLQQRPDPEPDRRVGTASVRHPRTWSSTPGTTPARSTSASPARTVRRPSSEPFTLGCHARRSSSCTGVDPIGGPLPSFAAGDHTTLILWNSARMAAQPGNDAAAIAALEAKLGVLAARPEVDGLVVDLASQPHVTAAHAQADAATSCVYAQNLVAQSIKDVVDAARTANPAWSTSCSSALTREIPFFRYPDQRLLGPESELRRRRCATARVAGQPATQLRARPGPVRRVADGERRRRRSSRCRSSPSAASSRPPPRSTTVHRRLPASPTTASSPTPTSLARHRLRLPHRRRRGGPGRVRRPGTGTATNDTLITAADISPQDPLSAGPPTTCARPARPAPRPHVPRRPLQRQQRAGRRLRDRACSPPSSQPRPVDLTNAIVFSAGCHSGYNIVDGDAVPG